MKYVLLIVFSLLLFHPRHASAQIITTVVGSGIGDDSLAVSCELTDPVGIATDTAGNTYIADQYSYRIRKVDKAGIITTLAGNGIYGHTGDGGPATAASIDYHTIGITADNAGNVYFTEGTYNCVRKISAAGIITTIAGNGTAGYLGDGGPAIAAELNTPSDVAVDTAGNIFIADWYNSVVRKIDKTGMISTYVGDGSTSGTGDGGPATASELGRPFRLTFDNKGNLYIAAVVFQCISMVDLTGTIHLVGGTGAYSVGPDGDGGPATAATMTSPCGLAVDTSGHVFFSDISNHRIRVIDMVTGLISTYAATGTAGYGGDGGPATAAKISTPEGVASDVHGNVLVCDLDNHRIRKINAATNVMSTFAGQNGLFEEGYKGVSTKLLGPADLDADTAGNVYITDEDNHRVRMLNKATGIITTIAGSGVSGNGHTFSGDGGPATDANMYYPSSVALDKAGNIYITDQDNQRIRKVNTAGIINTIAGNGTAGFGGDGGSALAASLHFPVGLVVSDQGDIYFCDNNNQRIRKINAAGIISTITGIGTAGYSGDGGPASAATVSYPSGVALDGAGNLYICDGGNNRIRKIDTSGVITTVAGDGTYGYSGDNGPATGAQLWAPYAMKCDKAGNIYIADHGNDVVRKVDLSGYVTTIAGNGARGFSGDGGPATNAMLYHTTGVAIDTKGDLYIADGGNNRVRRIDIPLPVVVNKVNTLAMPAIGVFPNPATNMMTISNVAGNKLELFDIRGRQLMEAQALTKKTDIDLSAFAPGVYTLQATGGDGAKRTVKVIKR